MRAKLATFLTAALAATLLACGAPAVAQPDAPSIRATPDRPILLLDQVRSGPLPQELGPLIEPLKTLEQVEALLRSRGIAFERRKGGVDTRALGPQLARVIASLPPGEVFVIPEAGVVTFNQVLRALSPEEAAALQARQPPPRPL